MFLLQKNDPFGVSLTYWLWYQVFIFLFSMMMILFSWMKTEIVLSWMVFSLDNYSFEINLFINNFSLLFMACVGMVSSMVMIFSNFYMEEAMMKKKFINCMTLFTISMFMLSVSSDLFWVMIGWDGLGLSSFFLIMFYKSWKSMKSAMITFISNRMGDYFIIISIIILSVSGEDLSIWSKSGMIIGIIMSVGAFSKSAQLPFSAWLPMAMAAPTPVSSLVHSSTLVTAGVFLLIRFSNFLSKESLSFVFFVSFMTVLLAGMSSVCEYDLKKIIALSTLSHVGLMMMFIGMEMVFASKLHFFIHAFFKSYLFLISGFMIHGMKETQDIRSMSVKILDKYFSISFLMACLSMIGAPFFAGFFSKEMMLEMLTQSCKSMMMVICFLIAVLMTCSYSFRLMKHLLFSPVLSFMSTGTGTVPFFIGGLYSAFGSGLMIFSLLSSEKTLDSTFSSSKLILYMFFIFGISISLCMFSLKVSFLISYQMWMIFSINSSFREMLIKSSFFFFTKGDIKGILDYSLNEGIQTMKKCSNISMIGFFLNPMFFYKTCALMSVGILFFYVF